ncbi:MAG TPA: cellulase family glycosylhydrolase [Candidatus Binatia bacterium]|nr:cellulase family glycosylhydrolase [Candidatus Binatia bacterium]
MRRARVSVRAVAALAIVAALATGCSDASRSSPAPALRLVALHAEPDPVGGGRIVDAEGRTVILRGVNVNALAEYWQGTSFPTTFPFTADDADRIAAIGWNAVRLLLSWSRVEPAPGEIDEAYLAEADAAIALLAERGVYSIVDLHQDAWNATLVARPDESCAPPTEPAFGWDGAPGWATLDGGAPRCTRGGVRESSPAVLAAWGAFWSDATGPGGVGIRTRYAEMWGALARRWAGRPEIAGFDLMNEPNAFGGPAEASMSDMYADALTAIRAGEQAARDAGVEDVEPHLVLFEPSAIWSATGNGPPPDFAHDRDVVYAPHVYTGGFSNGPITAAAFQTAIDEARRFGGAPVLSGEWGTDPRRASDPADEYFVEHQDLQDEFRVSATLWTWHESCGDPHKAGDYRAGRVPYVWGEFEVDCTTNEITGLRTDLIDDLTRGWVRAAPGVLTSMRWDGESGVLEASGVADREGIELLAFLPASKSGDPSLQTSGLADVRTQPAPGGTSYVLTGHSAGGAWSLRAAGR